jgi:hypothetical protein
MRTKLFLAGLVAAALVLAALGLTISLGRRIAYGRSAAH